MTRWSILVLVTLNLALAAWNMGAFARWGWAPDSGREPERMDQQIRPEAITLLPAPAPSAAASSASNPDTPAN